MTTMQYKVTQRRRPCTLTITDKALVLDQPYLIRYDRQSYIPLKRIDFVNYNHQFFGTDYITIHWRSPLGQIVLKWHTKDALELTGIIRELI